MPVGDTGQMATETAQHQATRRPGGRSARVRAAVHRAVQELLAEDTGDQLTIPAVAARAGVHPTTVYRRWGSVGELLTDVATSRFSGVLVVPDSGNLREDLERYAADVAKDLSDPDSLALVRAAVGAGGENVDVCQAERQEQLQAILERGRARGDDAVPSVERAVDGLLAPIYYRAVFTSRPPSPEWARSLVAHLLPQ